MSAFSTTQLSAYTKRIYGDIRVQLEKQNVLYGAFKKVADVKPMNGTVLYEVAEYGRHTGIGARTEGGALPRAGRRKGAQFNVSLKNLYGRTSFSGQVFEQMNSDKAAFGATVGHQIETLKEDFLKDFNRQMWGKGFGALCMTNGAGTASATLIVDTPIVGSFATQYLYEGQTIDIWTTESTGGSQSVTAAVIQSVDSATQVTLTTTQTWADNSFVFLELNRNNELTGLQSAIDDGTIKDSYFGITRSTNRYWQSIRTAIGAAATEAVVLNALSQVSKQEKSDILITSYEIFNAIAKTQLSTKRYNLDMGGKVGAIPAGYDGLNISNIMMYADQDCPYDTVANSGKLFGFKGSNMHLLSTADAQFMDRDGSIYHRLYDEDGYEVTMFQYAEVVDTRSNAAFVLTGLQA